MRHLRGEVDAPRGVGSRIWPFFGTKVGGRCREYDSTEREENRYHLHKHRRLIDRMSPTDPGSSRGGELLGELRLLTQWRAMSVTSCGA